MSVIDIEDLETEVIEEDSDELSLALIRTQNKRIELRQMQIISMIDGVNKTLDDLNNRVQVLQSSQPTRSSLKTITTKIYSIQQNIGILKNRAQWLDRLIGVFTWLFSRN